MQHVRWTYQPQLKDPVLVLAFEGWNDAGDAASGTVHYLVDRWDASPFADIDPEEFYDFTSNRPEVRLDDDDQRVIHWPANQFWSGKIAGSDRDVILLLGVEPGLKWRTFSEQVVGVAHRLGVSMTVTLGALLAEVAHTRPASVFATTQHPSLTARFGIEGSQYQGPTGIVGALSSALNAADVPTVSMWAAVPTYVPSAQSPKAILALVQALGALLQAPMITTDLEIAAAAYDRQINELVSEDDDTLEYVTALEARHDHDEDDPPFDLGHGLAEEIEQFLREQE